MKHVFAVLFVLLVMFLSAGCGKERSETNGEPGVLVLRLDVDNQIAFVPTQALRSTRAVPSLSTFALEILQGESLIQHLPALGNSTAPNFTLPAGDYAVKVYSQAFTTPAFDTPVYGVQQDFTITAGATKELSLECRQTNAGVKIDYSPQFIQEHTAYSARIEHPAGALAYPSGETRTGYFTPEYVNLIITADGIDFTQQLLLQPRRLYTVTVKDEEVTTTTGKTNISITVKTDVEQEAVEITFPASNPPDDSGGTGDTETLYAENMGNLNPSGTNPYSPVSLYRNWQCASVTYSGGGTLRYEPQSVSDYTGASGDYLLRLSGGTVFSVSGINTLGYTSLALSFGCTNLDRPFESGDLTVEASTAENPGNTTPLVYTRNEAQGWQRAIAATGVPASSALTLTFSSQYNYIYLDDLKITGKK